MKKPLSQKRIEQLEQLLRRLRQNVFDPVKGDRCGLLIDKVKSRLIPSWNERYVSQNNYHWMYAAE